jgi:phage terminase large subunit
LNEKWGIRTFWCDSARPEYIADFRQHGLDSRKGKKELDPGIAVVNRYLDDGHLKIDFNTCPSTINEFELYHYEEDDMGTILKNRPVDRDNHAMDAVRYMIHSFDKRGYVGTSNTGR